MTHVSQPKGQPDFDVDEDLFDFAGVVREPEPDGNEEDLDQIFASFRDAPPSEELLNVPNAPAAVPPAPVHAAAHAPARPAAPAPTAPRATAPREPAAPAPEPTHELAPAARGTRLSKGVVAIALAVTALNSVLALVVLRSRPSGGAGVVASEPESDSAHGPLAAAPHTPAMALPEPETIDASLSHPTLDEARAQISRGEYAAARQKVYALLAIIDRLEDPRRGALEADCQFLIAQSLHLEALARMGGGE